MKNMPSTIIEKDENFSALLGQGLTITLCTIQVPSKAKMIIASFGNYINLPNTHWGHVIWSIKRNGVPCERYGAILDELGLSFDPREVKGLVFEGGDTLTITATDDNVVVQPPLLIAGVALRWELF